MNGSDIRYQTSDLRDNGCQTVVIGGIVALGCLMAVPVRAEVPIRAANGQTYQITVNSPADGVITPDAQLTLREAIALTNGDIQLNDLSQAEQRQIQPQATHSTIRFQLPKAEPIALQSLLPPLRQAGLVLDGQNQVSLIPASPDLLPRGLLIIADDITVQGLTLYGFHSNQQPDYPFVGSVVVTTGQMLYDLGRLTDIVQLEPPKNVRLIGNTFGIQSSNETKLTSGFGVILYEAIAAQISNNQFLHLNGSAILTGKTAQASDIRDNLFLENGGNGLRDAVRLEGKIADIRLTNNRFCGNSGAGIFLFKPEGAIAVADNLFYGNGLRQKDEFVTTHPDGGIAAIYLMGSQHQVTGNEFVNQGGAGVVVAAYPQSQGNQITDNVFAQLQGLSIDLVTRTASDIYAYQSGDGANPWRDSPNRRIDTGNGAVNAPRFVGLEFFPFGDRVQISGTADPAVEVVLYQVFEADQQFGPLSAELARTTTDEAGKFTFSLEDWEYGDRLSALALDPVHGTSEPAENAVIRSFDESFADVQIDNLSMTTAEQVCRPFLMPDTEPQ